jgi:ribosomal protein S18 acetylase RimI-like enzyme
MSTGEVELRECTPRDRALLRALIAAYHAEDRVAHDADALEAIVTPLLDGTYGRIWMIVAAGEVVGYVAMCFGYSIEFGGRDAFIDEIYLVPAHRGRGIGKATLEHLEVEARAFGVRALHLEVDHDNPAAHLYERVGFRSRNRYRLMSKPLVP